MTEIIEHFHNQGFIVSDFLPNGKIQRFKVDESDSKKSGWYVGYRNFLKTTGQEFFVVAYGSWREGEIKTYSTLKGALGKDEKKEVDKQIKKATDTAEKERQVSQERVSHEVEKLWETLHPIGHSSYLTQKKIPPGQYGVRYDDKGNLYVPARDCHGRLWSFQRITWDGTKFFHPGGRIRGCFFALGNLEDQRIYLVEGVATGLSVYIATGRCTVVSFSAGNLVEVGQALKKHRPELSIIICGDDDEAGRTKGDETARLTLGKAIYPIGGNDWNDVFGERGALEVKKQLEEVRVPKAFIIALGFREKDYFFTSSHNQQIVIISNFSKVDLLGLMPIEYWETLYPGRGAQRINWDDATTSLMEQARKRGIFENQNIRGAGVWSDRDRVVVNMGDHLLVDGRKTEFSEIESNYFYTLGNHLSDLHPNPLTAKECETIVSACTKFKWKGKDFGILLAGAMVTTRVSGALPIRPHLWLTGEKGSGKTTLFNRLIYPLVGDPLIFAGGSSTEAGIRQAVCANAIPVLFDEFETHGGRSIERIQGILDLMRLSWSETNASIIKGSSGGTISKYRARFAAIVTSIRQVSMTDADKSRFATIELAPHHSDLLHWKELDTLLNQITVELGNRLFSRTIKLLPVLLQNFRMMKRALSKMGPGQRFADQYGMLLGGFGLLLQDDPIDESQAQFLCTNVLLEEEKEDSLIIDHEQALQHLLTTSVRVEGSTWTKMVPIGILIESVSRTMAPEDHEVSALLRSGIRVESEIVLIPSGTHAEFSKIWKDSRWEKSWNVLTRITGAKRDHRRIAGVVSRCISIPKEHFIA